MSLFEKLFSSSQSESDSWNQSQREALVDLLVLAMYTDNNLSLAEDAILKDQMDRFQWEGNTPLEYYVDEAITRVRTLKNSESSIIELLEFISDRLSDYEAKQVAVGICERLLTSDGKEDSEKAFLDKVYTTLKLR